MLLEVASRVKPNLELKFANIQAMREEIARIAPMYAGIEKLALHGDSVQYGGRRLLEGGASLEDYRPSWANVEPGHIAQDVLEAAYWIVAQ